MNISLETQLKIMYLGIAVWPSWEFAAKKMWIWRKSLDRFGYRFFYYGVGIQQFPGYRTQKIEVPLAHLKEHGWGDCTHILYTDCCDCLMLAPPGEIETKYEALGRPPMLISGSAQLSNVSDPARYPIFDQGSELFRGTANDPDRLATPFHGHFFARLEPGNINFHSGACGFGTLGRLESADERNGGRDAANGAGTSGGNQPSPLTGVDLVAVGKGFTHENPQ